MTDVRIVFSVFVMIFLAAIWFEQKSSSEKVRAAASSIMSGYLWLGIILSIVLPLLWPVVQFVDDFIKHS